MATHVRNKATTTTWEIDETGDTWILGEKGSITGAGMIGISADASIDAAKIRVNGEIDIAALSSGISLLAQNADVRIGETGRISASEHSVLYNNPTGSVTIDNNGLLESLYTIAAYTAQNGAEIRNGGHIRATAYGIDSGAAGAEIVNSGVIKSVIGIFAHSQASDTADPLDAANATHMVNTGKVTGSDYSFLADGVAVNIRNTGTMNGDVWLDDGHDVVNNSGGTIIGDVTLGAGNDVFDGRGGRLDGILYGGDGHDIVTLGSPATLYVENAGEGTDTVRINSTYRLGANIEDLTLLGKASHTGIGNGLDNTMIGNKGANVLYGLDSGDILIGGKGNDLLFGGSDADRFVFKAGYGKDTIGDFEAGLDHIDLTDFGFADFAAFEALITEVGDDLVIAFNDTDKLVIRDGVANNVVLDAADFYL